MRPDFSTLSSPELVKDFNAMAAELASLSEGAGVPPVKRFATRDAGLRRIETLYKALREKKGEEYEEPPIAEATASVAQKPKSKPKPKKTEQGRKQKVQNGKKVASQKVRSVKSEIVELCKVSGGTNRARALDFLCARVGKQCPVQSIMTAVYGPAAEKTTDTAFFTVMKGLSRDLANSKCNYEIKRVRDEKGNTSYGLYSSG